MISGFRSRCTVNSTNDTLSRESFQERSGVNAKKASNWNTAIGDENFLSRAGAIDPFTEVGSQVAHSDVHPFSVQHHSIHLYNSSMFLGTRHPSNHPSHLSDGERQCRQGATENSVNIDKVDLRRPAATDQLPFQARSVATFDTHLHPHRGRDSTMATAAWPAEEQTRPSRSAWLLAFRSSSDQGTSALSQTSAPTCSSSSFKSSRSGSRSWSPFRYRLSWRRRGPTVCGPGLRRAGAFLALTA